MQTLSTKAMVEVLDPEIPTVYLVKGFKVYSTQWEIYFEGELVELTPMESSIFDLQQRIVQAYTDISEGRELESSEDSLNYVEFLMHEKGLDTRLKERVEDAQLSQCIFNSMTYQEIEVLILEANEEYFENLDKDEIIAHAKELAKIRKGL